MKLFTLAAAGATMLAGLAPVALATPAAAQTHTVVTHRTVVRTTGPRYRYRTVCRTTYRHHERIRTCRKVRVRVRY